MSRFIVQIDMGNAAFDENQGNEVSRILKELADRLATFHPDDLSSIHIKLYDFNGNLTGVAKEVL